MVDVPTEFRRVMTEVHTQFIKMMHVDFSLQEPSPCRIIATWEPHGAVEQMLYNHSTGEPLEIILHGNVGLNGTYKDLEATLGGWAWEITHPAWIYDRLFSCAHESAHYIHALTHPEFFVNPDDEKFGLRAKKNQFRETVANFAAFAYLDRSGILAQSLPHILLQPHARGARNGYLRGQKTVAELARVSVKNIPMVTVSDYSEKCNLSFYERGQQGYLSDDFDC
jgi:hypothetical protein